MLAHMYSGLYDEECSQFHVPNCQDISSDHIFGFQKPERHLRSRFRTTSSSSYQTHKRHKHLRCDLFIKVHQL